MRKLLLLPLLYLLLTGCAPTVTPPPATLTASPLPFATATLLPTFTPRASATPAPPTVAPTVAPVEGSVTSQINVRSGPGQGRDSLGLVEYGAKVRIVGKDASGKWLQIVYPENSTSTGWVTAAYVQSDGIDKIPVIGSDGAPQATVPAPAATPLSDATAAPVTTPTPTGNTIVTKTINVRSGPATSYDLIGTLAANTSVTLTGRNEINTWIQIEFAAGPDGRGWVAALYVQDPKLSGLPIYDNQGQLISTPAASGGQPGLTPTAFAPAPEDGDSEDIPAGRLTFSPAGARLFTYSSDLSAPSGDATDWLAFTPYGPSNQSSYVYFDLRCTGNGGITVTLEQDGVRVPDVQPLVCGMYDLAVKVIGGKEYMLILTADGSGSDLRYVSYTLTLAAVRR